MSERTLRETVEGMKAADHYQTEFHRGWNVALDAVVAFLDAHTAAQPAPDAVAEAEPVAWRWRYDPEGPWFYGSSVPKVSRGWDEAGDVEPLFAKGTQP